MGDNRNWYDPVPRWLVIAVFVSTPLLGGLGWLVVNWDKVEINAPRMWKAAARVVGKAEPTPAVAPPVTPPEPPLQKKPEPVKESLPCVDDAAELAAMIQAAGGDKYERAFNKHFKGRDTCFILSLTATGDLRMEFASPGSWMRKDPTIFVQPRLSTDLRKYKPGTKLRIFGELERYTDTSTDQPDRIYVVRARLIEPSAADGRLVTGSVRR